MKGTDTWHAQCQDTSLYYYECLCIMTPHTSLGKTLRHILQFL